MNLPRANPGPGRLIVISGCMFSGKTRRLIERLREAQRQGRRVLAVKHRIDDRYDATHLVTHDDDRFDAVRAADAADILRLSEKADVVAIDEGHFFASALIETALALTRHGKDVVVAGISHDAWGRPFTPMPQLAGLADEAIEAFAPCRTCGADARYSQRMAAVYDNLMVGGAESYEPRCEKCFQPLPGPAPVQP